MAEISEGEGRMNGKKRKGISRRGFMQLVGAGAIATTFTTR